MICSFVKILVFLDGFASRLFHEMTAADIDVVLIDAVS